MVLLSTQTKGSIFFSLGLSFVLLFFFFFFCLFRATPVAYGSSQARGQIGATAASHSHSHNNPWSEQHLWPITQLMATWILNPVNEARDQTHVLMDPSWFCYCWATTGTPSPLFFCTFYSHQCSYTSRTEEKKIYVYHLGNRWNKAPNCYLNLDGRLWSLPSHLP